MPYIPKPKNISLPTTQAWDISSIQKTDVNTPEFKELIVRLYQHINRIALVVGKKESGLYLEEEFLTAQGYYNPNAAINVELRPVYRLVVNTGALGAGATVVAHGLITTNTWHFVHIYGAANYWNAAAANRRYCSLPWVSAGGAANIEVMVDGTNITITNNSGITFDDSSVVLEYVKT